MLTQHNRMHRWFAVVVTIATLTFGQLAHASELSVERLTWAGVKLVAGDTTVFVDAVGTDLWDGNAPEGFVPVTAETRRRYAVITHAHNDHFDLETLKAVLGERGYVICHESIATYIASRGLRVIPVKTYHPVERGGFYFTAVPADDGFGSEQVSWVISHSGKKIFHGGDTLWHGRLETIGAQFGPIDIAFLPINGARVARNTMPETPAVMTPLQAVDAAKFLGAKLLVPIHFGLNGDENYVEVDQPLNELKKAAKRRDQPIKHLVPGKTLTLDGSSHPN